MQPEIDAGTLDRRVMLLQPIYNPELDEITGWTEVSEVWAAVNPNYGQELTEAARTIATVLVPVVIRYRPDVDARWRIRDGNMQYEVKAMLDVARRHVQLHLSCEEVQ